jgi:hypothetical protein
MIADARGRIIVAFSSVATTHLPKAYDASGRFLRQIGAEGEGPGEFRRGELLTLGGNDSIFVIDKQLGRRSDFRPDFTFVKSLLMLPRVDAAVRLRTGDWVLNTEVNDRERVGRSFHLFGADPPDVAGARWRVLVRALDAQVCHRALDRLWHQDAVH